MIFFPISYVYGTDSEIKEIIPNLNDGYAHTQVEKIWTNLIYLNADNDLGRFVFPCLKSIEQIGSSDNVNVLVQFDGPLANDSKRMLIRKIPSSGISNNLIFAENTEYDMLDPKTVSDFLEWGIKSYPGKRIVFSLVAHGAGIFNFPKQKDNSNHRSKSSEFENVPHDSIWAHINQKEMISNIQDVLIKSNNGKKIELFLYNSCLMGNFETLATLSSIAKYAVASEYLISYDAKDLPTQDTYGISFMSLLNYLTCNPKAEIREIGCCLIDTFRKRYKHYGYYHSRTGKTFYPAASLILYNLSVCSDIENYLTIMVKEIQQQINHNPALFELLFIELLKVHKVDTSILYIDFGHFTEIMSRITGLKSAKILHDCLCASTDFIMSKAIMHTSAKTHPCGVSIFFPNGIIAGQIDTSQSSYRSYQDLEIVKKTGWGNFVDSYLHFIEENRVDILRKIVEGLINKNKKIQFEHPWDGYYSEVYLFLVTEIAFYPLLIKGDFDRVGRYIEMIIESDYQSPQFNKHRKDMYMCLKRNRDEETDPYRYGKIENLLSKFSEINISPTY